MSDTSHSGQESEDRRGKHWKAKIEKGKFVKPQTTKAREDLASAVTTFENILKALFDLYILSVS